MSELHPEMRRRYRLAWEAWCADPRLAEACAVLGMSDLEWAKLYVEQFGPITYTTNTTAPAYIFDPFLAWAEARQTDAALSGETE